MNEHPAIKWERELSAPSSEDASRGTSDAYPGIGFRLSRDPYPHRDSYSLTVEGGMFDGDRFLSLLVYFEPAERRLWWRVEGNPMVRTMPRRHSDFAGPDLDELVYELWPEWQARTRRSIQQALLEDDQVMCHCGTSAVECCPICTYAACQAHAAGSCDCSPDVQVLRLEAVA